MMAEPKDKSNYSYHLVDAIGVYLPKNLQTKNNEVLIRYSKFLWNEDLVVDGIKLERI